MPYQLIIHHDDKEPEIAMQGTFEEVIKSMPGVAARLDPDTAIWEVKFKPSTCVVDEQLLVHQMGGRNGGHFTKI